jgi:thiamine biosynthesis protein ThiI
MDKDEIVGQAQQIGTFPISIIPDQDCCTLFTPKHPATRARLRFVEHAEQALPIEGLVSAAIAGTAMEDFKYPM